MLPPKTFFFLCSLLATGAIGPVRAAEESAAAPAPAAPAVQHPLRQIMLAEGSEAAQALVPVEGGGFVVVAPTLSFLKLAELTKRLAPAENRPIEDRLLAGIAQVIENYVRQSDYPLARVLIPPQNIASGTVRVAVLLGRFRDITFKGNQWFSESLLREKLRVEQGSTIRLSTLESAVNWANNSNSFRRVQVHIDPIPDSDEANLIIGVQDRLPLRLVLSADTGGNQFIGRNRFVAGLTYGNLWGRDHEASYQFITTEKTDVYQGHGLGYRVPLPWHHYLQIGGSYAVAKPVLFEVLDQKAVSVSADVRYTMPVREGNNPIEAFAALSFKESNNNLEFGGTNVQSTNSDIFQLTLGVTAIRRDKRGAWLFSAGATGSPGGINSRNTDAVFGGTFDSFGNITFQGVRFGAKAAYAYATFSAQRFQPLVAKWDWNSRFTVQFASENLLASEQISIGGATTVRGFRESVLGGDQGYVMSHELLTPPWKTALSPAFGKKLPPLEARGLFFFDSGDVTVKHRYRGDPTFTALASVGVGLRASIATNFSLTADYGWQLTYLPYKTDEKSRGNLKLVLAF